MSFHAMRQVLNKKTGKKFYYVDDVRVSKERFESLNWGRKECVTTTTCKTFERQFHTVKH